MAFIQQQHVLFTTEIIPYVFRNSKNKKRLYVRFLCCRGRRVVKFYPESDIEIVELVEYFHLTQQLLKHLKDVFFNSSSSSSQITILTMHHRKSTLMQNIIITISQITISQIIISQIINISNHHYHHITNH